MVVQHTAIIFAAYHVLRSCSTHMTSTLSATVIATPLPANALLLRYAGPTGYTDCYATEVPGAVSHQAFVHAFYTSPVFRIERVLLRWFAGRASTEGDAAALASGACDRFAAWDVEGRADNQLLLADFTGRTRSWFMVLPMHGAGGQSAAGPCTRLYFGSAVVPRIREATGEGSMGAMFYALLGFHRVYSRTLLWAARRRVLKQADFAGLHSGL